MNVYQRDASWFRRPDVRSLRASWATCTRLVVGEKPEVLGYFVLDGSGEFSEVLTDIEPETWLSIDAG